MAENTTVFNPSGLLDPRGAIQLEQLLWQNFYIINEGPGYTRQPTRVDGQPTTQPGSPTFGQHYIFSLWVDSFNSLWRCSASGIPGTWVQIEPASFVGDFPPTTNLPPGYLVVRPDQGFATFYWNGTEWVAISGGGTNIEAGDNIEIDSSSGTSSIISVKSNPWFKGVTRADVHQFQSTLTPPTPIPNGFTTWSTQVSLPEGLATISLVQGPSGESAIASSHLA